MIYDGFIALDTRGGDVSMGDMNNIKNNPTTVMQSEANTKESSYDEGPIPGIGGGPIVPKPTIPPPTPKPVTTPAKGWQQYVTADTLAAGIGLIGSVAALAQKSPEAKTLKAVCGRKPLFNIGGKKDKYLACVDKYVFQQNQPATPAAAAGMSTGAKVGIVIGIVIVLGLITVMIIKMSKVESELATAK